MSLITVALMSIAAAVAVDPLILRAPQLSDGVLWVMQRGEDVRVDVGGQRYDLPNGAWGLELIPVVAGQQVSIGSLAEADRFQIQWIDLDTAGADEAPAIRKFLEAQRLLAAGELEAAAAAWQSVADLADQADRALLALHARYLKAEALMRSGEYQSAAELLAAIQSSAADPLLSGALLYKLGSALFRLGELDRAADYFARSETEATRIGDTYGRLIARRQACYVVHRRSPAAAIDCYLAVEEEPEMMMFPRIKAAIMNARASALADTGQSEQSMVTFAATIALQIELEADGAAALSRYNLANAQKRAGVYIPALGNYLQAYRYFRTSNRRRQLELTTIALGDLYRRLGDDGLAEGWYRQALKLPDSDAQRGYTFAHLGLARLATQRGRWEDAGGHLQAVAGALEAPSLRPRVLMEWVRFSVASGQSVAANGQLADACADLAEAGAGELLGQCYYWLARLALADQDDQKTQSLMRVARQQELSPELRVAFSILDIRLALQTERPADALQMVNVAVDHLAALASRAPNWQTFNFYQIHSELWDLAMLAALEGALTESDIANELWRLDVLRRQILIRAYRTEGERLVDDRLDLSELSSWSEALLADQEIPADETERLLVIDVASAAEPDAVVPATADPKLPTVSFWLGETRSAAIVSQQKARYWVELPPRSELEPSVRQARDLVLSGQAGAADHLRALYRLVWAPLAQHVPSSGPVDLAQDGVLALIPFEALIAADNRPLGARYDFAYGYSAGLGAATHLDRNDAATVFAAPDYRGLRAALDQSFGEADIAQSTFRSAQIHVATEATRGNFLRAMTQVSPVVHIAAHARWDPRLPARSGLWLAEPGGFVSARELAAMSAPARLIFLSACSTNVGPEPLAGPVQSLTLAALTAGAETVVATAWDVADVAALQFTDHFYAAVAEGFSVREAAARSRRAMMNSPFWREPRHWSAFQVWKR